MGSLLNKIQERLSQYSKPITRCIANMSLQRRIQSQWAKGSGNGFLPRQLAIETSNNCNARCIICPQGVMKRKRGIMSDEMHRQIVDKIAEWGAPISSISHAGLGEPLTDKTLENKIRYEKKVFSDAQVVVCTNAGLLDETRTQSLLESGLDTISVSLNGFRKETYEAFMRIPHERTLNNVLKLLRVAEANGTNAKVQVSLIPTSLHTAQEINEFRTFWSERVHAVVIPPWISWGKFLPNDLAERQWPCRYIWEVFQLDWDGTVAMCCEDYDTLFPLGNIVNQTPDEIFNSPRMQKQRNNQVKGNFKWPEICQNCVETHDVAKSFWEVADLIPGNKAELTIK